MSSFFILAAFFVSLTAFCYGSVRLSGQGTPKHFRPYACAAGCYMLEELWVIVNMLLGNGGRDGLVTVRLVGFFGCLSFMLSANAHEFDQIVDEGTDKKARTLSLLAPAALILLYLFYAFSPENTNSIPVNIIGFLSLFPALPASRLSAKHLLLKNDPMGFLGITRDIDILLLLFFAANYLYPILHLYLPQHIMSAYDLLLAAMLFILMFLCRKGAKKWSHLI